MFLFPEIHINKHSSIENNAYIGVVLIIIIKNFFYKNSGEFFKFTFKPWVKFFNAYGYFVGLFFCNSTLEH